MKTRKVKERYDGRETIFCVKMFNKLKANLKVLHKNDPGSSFFGRVVKRGSEGQIETFVLSQHLTQL